MKKARDLLRSFAVTVIAVAVATSAHAQRATPSSGVVMIYVQPPHDFACTQAYAPARIGIAVEGPGPEGHGLNGAYARFGRAVGAEWPQLIPAALGRVLQDASLNSPSAAGIYAISYDLQSAYRRTLDAAGCQGGELRTAPMVQTDPAETPEPATWAFLVLGAGLVGIALRARRAKARGCSPA